MNQFSLLRARLCWAFVQAWEFWLALASVAGATTVCWLGTEFHLRTYGFVLQVLGAATAAHAILSNERLFSLPRFKERIAAWAKRFPQKHAVVGTANSTMGSMTTAARAISRNPRRAEDPLDRQIELLWLNFSAIDTELSTLFQRVDRNKHENAEALTKEADARTEEIRALRVMLEAAAVGSPMAAYLGVFVVLLGSGVATFSAELHVLLGQG